MNFITVSFSTWQSVSRPMMHIGGILCMLGFTQPCSLLTVGHTVSIVSQLIGV